jgi:hypothetical protein
VDDFVEEDLERDVEERFVPDDFLELCDRLRRDRSATFGFWPKVKINGSLP